MKIKSFKDWIIKENAINLIEGEEMVDTIGYHVSNKVFDQFDDKRLGSNTFQSQQSGKHKIYSIDSFFGHQFVEDPNFLYQYKKRDLLGNLMYKVNLRIGKTAIINIKKLIAECPDYQTALQCKQQLQQAGHNGMRLIGGESNRLTNNTLVAFSSNSIRIRSLKNLKTGMEIQAKNGSFQDQINALKNDQQHMKKVNSIAVDPKNQPENINQLPLKS
jgi:hypothetical protein